MKEEKNKNVTRGGVLKFRKLKEKNWISTGIKVFTVFCVLLVVGVFFYTTYAYYEEQKSLEIINGTVEDPGDLYFAIYVDGAVTYNIPSSTDGYVFSSGICTNGAFITWNNSTWTASVNFSTFVNSDNSRTKCTLNFETFTSADSYITSLYSAGSTELAYDDNNNLRYIGAAPNNYIDIGDVVYWRIIGIFEVDDGTGNTETRLKIIRSSSIGTYAWDNKPSGTGTSTSSYGSNDWTDARLMMLLNDGYEDGVDDGIYDYEGSLYWNSKSGTCYSGSSGATKDCDFTETGLTTTAQAYFDDAVWTLGGTASYTSSSNGLSSHWYEYERGTTVYSGHATTWIGKIGLMYPSDYGYATSGGETYDRDTCLATVLYSWNSYSDCYSNNWLYTVSYTWTLSAYSSGTYDMFSVYRTGSVSIASVYNAYAVLPVGYLQSSISITSGDGSESTPFIASLS